MITDHDRAADRGPVPLKRLLIGTAALPAAAFGLMMFFSPDADAVPIPYAIPSAVVSFTTGGVSGSVGSVSGSFTFDPSTGIYSNVDLHLSNTQAATNGPFIVAVPASSDDELLFASNGTTPAGDVEIQFANPLSNAVDPITGVFFETNATFGGQFKRVNASADPQVPEPTSMAVLGTALGLLALGRWKFRQQ